jgi:hypothetical protein
LNDRPIIVQAMRDEFHNLHWRPPSLLGIREIIYLVKIELEQLAPVFTPDRPDTWRVGPRPWRRQE